MPGGAEADPAVQATPAAQAGPIAQAAAASLDVMRVLQDGRLDLVGRLWASTNQAMLGTVVEAGGGDGTPVTIEVVYKPTAGERPLHDFPPGTLTRREVAAFLVSEATGWGIVPPTVLRDGLFGEGMVQAWVHPDPDADVIAMIVGDDERLRAIAVFDAMINNTDRKGGHLLPLPSGHVHGVDHGVCFSPQPKLRTVLWAWRGLPLSPIELAVIQRVRTELDGALGGSLMSLLTRYEVAATIERVDALLRDGRFPEPPTDWPAVPWPPF
ncbi:MAG: SCO1664 family protein [Chloroflexota bacterium]